MPSNAAEIIERYESIEAREFTTSDIIMMKGETEQEIIDHEGWLAVAGGNRDLLKEYTKKVFERRDVSRRYILMGFILNADNPALDFLEIHDPHGESGISSELILSSSEDPTLLGIPINY